MANKTTKPAKTTKIANTDYDRWSDNGGSVKPIGKGVYGKSKGTPKKGK